MMEDRKRRVLQAIIDDYIQTAEPVASRTVARKYGLGVSAATIRNEMADLEDMGYLEQPHTSAGRVPSDKGYRFYVDVLVEPESPGVDVAGISDALAARAQRFEQVVREAARLLAEMTDFLALATPPSVEEERVCALQLVPLQDELAVLLLVADDGRVLTRMLQWSGPRDRGLMGQLADSLSRRFCGLPVRCVGAELAEAVAEALVPLEVADPALVAAFSGLFGGAEGEPLFVEGAANLFKQPEFREVQRAKQVLAALERTALLQERLGGAPAQGGRSEVVIGRELQIADMAECSLVTALYEAPGGVVGRIGVLGPRRMEYGRMMAVVEGVAAGVTAALHGRRRTVRLFFSEGGRERAGSAVPPPAASPAGAGGGNPAGGAESSGPGAQGGYGRRRRSPGRSA